MSSSVHCQLWMGSVSNLPNLVNKQSFLHCKQCVSVGAVYDGKFRHSCLPENGRRSNHSPFDAQ